MQQSVLVALEGTASLDASARRRRMHRRHAKRRLTRVGAAAATVFVLALLATPERVPQALAPSLDMRGPFGLTRAMAVSSLPLKPTWRPAGEVLRRKASPVPLLPFSANPHDVAQRETLTRWHQVYTYSTRYRIKPDLARRVFDAAVVAGIEPELAFRLVRVESVFNAKATSPVGAVGLTQLMLGTAREFEPTVTHEQLLDPDVNLRIGFKYLRTLIREYDGNLKIALLVYNRGPSAVQSAISLGRDPTNGYESMVMRGYHGRGVLD